MAIRRSFPTRGVLRRPPIRAVDVVVGAGILGFLDLLRRGFTEDEAPHQLDIAIASGRYGELFDYDANSGHLVLEPHATDEPAA